MTIINPQSLSKLGAGLVPISLKTVTKTKTRQGSYTLTSETTELRCFTRPLGSTDRVLLDTGDYTLNDRHFYFPGNPEINLDDTISYKNVEYEVRNVNPRTNMNYTHIVGKAPRR